MMTEAMVESIYSMFVRTLTIVFFGTVAASVGEALEQLKWSKRA